MAQKKHIKKSEEIKTVETKPVPPYPKWVVWMVIGAMILLANLSVFVFVKPSESEWYSLIPSFVLLAATGCYGIYRAFRHYPLRSFAFLDILIVAGIGIAFCPTCQAPIIGFWPKALTFEILGSSVFLLFLLSTVILSCYGIYRAFRYYPRRALIFLGLAVGLAVAGQIVEYMTRERDVRYDVEPIDMCSKAFKPMFGKNCSCTGCNQKSISW